MHLCIIENLLVEALHLAERDLADCCRLWLFMGPGFLMSEYLPFEHSVEPLLFELQLHCTFAWTSVYKGFLCN